MSDTKSVKINTTSEIPSGDVLKYTLNAMEEFDMNKINDAGKAGDFGAPDKLRGK